MKAKRGAALRFTGQPKVDRIDFRLSHPVGYLNNDLAETLSEALKFLASSIARERVQNVESFSDDARAVREALLGFGILAFNEARAFLIVAGAGLDRHSRIHFRSVMEYEFRARRIIDDPSRATAFLDAFSHEFRKTAKDLDLDDQVAIELEIDAVLGKSVAVKDTTSEKKALFGKAADVRRAMEELPNGSERYVGTFAWPSQVSHGSILALRDVAVASEGKTSDFLDAAGRDGYGDRLCYSIIWSALWLAHRITNIFENGILPGSEAIANRALEINRTLQIVSPEQEARAKIVRRTASASKDKTLR